MMSDEVIEIGFSSNTGKEIKLISSPGVFSPNKTSELLLSAVNKKITRPSKILDLGCGTGAVGLAIWLDGLAKEPVFASDLSVPSVQCSKKNFSFYNCTADIRCGSLFEPWFGEKFDIIVDDISGISEDIASVSPWFKDGVPCNTGSDGTNLVVDILQNASKYLSETGSFFFPVLSLSNVEQILKTAQENFKVVDLIERQEWPLPKELEIQIPLLKKLSEKGDIVLEERFGMVVCYTEVYLAKNPY